VQRVFAAGKNNQFSSCIICTPLVQLEVLMSWIPACGIHMLISCCCGASGDHINQHNSIVVMAAIAEAKTEAAPVVDKVYHLFSSLIQHIHVCKLCPWLNK
jgi:hypothetical protein